MTPQEIAAGVAADIRRLGHFKKSPDAGGGAYADLWSPGADDCKCCVMVNPSTWNLTAASVYFSFLNLLRTSVGVDLDGSTAGISEWSDTAPTAEVLATLDQIASSPVSAVLPGGTT